MKSFLSDIDTSNFSDIDFEILNFINNNINLVSNMNIEDLSNILFTSKSTIVRFCKKIKLDGFSELKYILKNESTTNTNIFNDFMSHNIYMYNNFVKNIELDKILSAVDLISNNDPLYIFGHSLSEIPAKYLYTVLNSLDRRCVFINKPILMKSISSSLDEKSTILIISANLNNSIYEDIVKTSINNKSKIILITRNHHSNLIPYANIAIFSNDKNISYKNIDVNSRIGIITIVQIIIELSYKKLLSK
ncbi:MurR/RpiR family transcriptional regulator [Miniphocaeibacter halophilus]|uniref:MurR/RpiR family transcriptional regulator n=1 Tax=Miniphocaeibacter halophilus TaxID=2931922 RepID=A0AC61MSI8_9FIRM|nr:MurR/RpiR family transcriptional regulator [Miniphocaeibacter halophilus]QQK07278.1 MurR/RpiR family transcriptional regulator [Miniphocaeibacter halophilus]